MQITTLGIDIAKSVFQLHGVDAAGNILFRKKVRQLALLDILASLDPCLIGMEACSLSKTTPVMRGPTSLHSNDTWGKF